MNGAAICGLILNAAGALLLLADSDRMFKTLAFLVGQMAASSGKLDSRKFSKQEMERLAVRIRRSRYCTAAGLICILVGFLLQLADLIAH